MTGVISTPNLAFYFPDETVKTLNERWDDWVARGATVVTKKDQAEDTPGILFELLRTDIRFTPGLTPAVAIAEPRLHREQTAASGIPIFYPCLPWQWPMILGARFRQEPDVLWAIPRELTASDFE
ncbi:MAG: hypothetical protein U0Q47_09405 [Mycobacterium sp.]|uniref:hypothetical protein n=1 Tax=Mycobacterium sp. PSTR-4-N TaxID=2917745 RepID=UPI001F14D537|nr:hypothetical protein [Mycobacterium sp. PSTR-4-N]MCG7597524.1 hypothetical protein [Mycobacterium sp. PSTR-4-N]